MKLYKLSLSHLILPVMLAGLLLEGCSDDNFASTADNTLQIGLAAGFADDHVTVAVNYRTVLDESVSTDMTIGMAKTFFAPVPHGRHQFTVTSIDDNISADTTVIVGGNTFLQVTLERSPTGSPVRFEIIISRQPPWQGQD